VLASGILFRTSKYGNVFHGRIFNACYMLRNTVQLKGHTGLQYVNVDKARQC